MLKEFLITLPFYLRIIAYIVGIIVWTWFMFYYPKLLSKKDSVVVTSLQTLSDKVSELSKSIEEIKQADKTIYRSPATNKVKWITIDASNAVPAIADVVSLVFKSTQGVVKGYIRGKGCEEEHFFDTSVNSDMPLAVKIKNAALEYRVISNTTPNQRFDIIVLGYRMNIR